MFNGALGNAGPSLDLVFILDCTGSMGSYVSPAVARHVVKLIENIEAICEQIYLDEKLQSADALRLAIVAYRDHPPQDASYVTKVLPFTSDVAEMKQFLANLYASGGGDGPEAVTAAMKASLELEWRPDSAKVSVLIADAPPHGIGEYGDGFAQGSPDGSDPLQLARQMSTLGIALVRISAKLHANGPDVSNQFVVACEPALSQYTHATDFFNAIAGLGGGVMLPLTDAQLLAKVIVGSALEHIDMERLIREVGQAVAERVHGGQSIDDVAQDLLSSLQLRNETTRHLRVKTIYRESAEASHNVNVWMNANDLASARPQLKKVTGSRFTDKYLETRYGVNRSIYRPAVPPRPAAPAKTPSPEASPVLGGTSPGSPSRKVASSFASFSAPKMSLGDTPVAASPQPVVHSMFGTIKPAADSSSGSARTGGFGSMRDGRGGMDDDDDDDDDGVTMKQAAISLDQAKRIATSAAFRSLRA